MSTAVIPQFQFHHRLALALEASGVRAEEMATDLGVHVNSIYNYLSGRREPKLGLVKQWALRTGVSLTWLLTGEGGATDTDSVTVGKLHDDDFAAWQLELFAA